MKDKALLHHVAQCVADAMGFEWMYVSPASEIEAGYRFARIDGPDESQIHIASDWPSELSEDAGEFKGKIRITGEYPRSSQAHAPFYRNEQYPAIGVSASRGPRAIAKDIHRRFVKDYLEMYEKCREAKRREEARDARTLANAQRIAQAGGGQAGELRDSCSITIPTGNVGMYGRRFCVHDDQVTIDMGGVPADLAVEIAATIRKYVEAH